MEQPFFLWRKHFLLGRELMVFIFIFFLSMHRFRLSCETTFSKKAGLPCACHFAVEKHIAQMRAFKHVQTKHLKQGTSTKNNETKRWCVQKALWKRMDGLKIPLTTEEWGLPQKTIFVSRNFLYVHLELLCLSHQHGDSQLWSRAKLRAPPTKGVRRFCDSPLANSAVWRNWETWTRITLSLSLCWKQLKRLQNSCRFLWFLLPWSSKSIWVCIPRVF